MILCAGEALIDMLPRQTGEELAFAPHPGGAVFNTAVALGRLGARVGFLSPLSTDMFGAVLTGALDAAGVDATLCPQTDRPTTLAFVTLDAGEARYAFYDENSAGRMLTEADLPDLPDAVEALFCGGISLMAEPCGSALEALFLHATDARVTMLDPNIRPGAIADADAYRARLARMIPTADIVKLSETDLHWLNGPGDPAAQAHRLLAQGPRLVLLTHGAGGASAYANKVTLHVPAEPVDVVDTVGAGDTFNAGVLAALQATGKLNKAAMAALSAETLDQALRLGVRAAAITVSRAGATPPHAADLA